MTISLTLNPIYNSDEIILYEGGIDRYENLISKIRESKKIPSSYVDKTTTFEGVYNIKIEKDGSIIEKYTVVNSTSIYDNQKQIFLKCSILEDLRGIVVLYLLKDKYIITVE
jgi:hypothetical protein